MAACRCRVDPVIRALDPYGALVHTARSLGICLGDGCGAKTSEDEAFWRFSLAFYERPGVVRGSDRAAGPRRLRCQPDSVCAVAWDLGARIRSAAIPWRRRERVAGTLRSEIVEPLRSLRRKLRHHPDRDVQRLREGVKALELAGEKLVQDRLARLAGSGRAKTDPAAGEPPPMPISRSISAGKGFSSKEAAVIAEALDAFAQDL